MRDRNFYDIDRNRLSRAVQAIPRPRPMRLADRLLLSVGLIVMPVAAFFLILAIDRLAAAF